MTEMVRLRDVVELSTGTRNPTREPATSFTYVDVAAVDNEEKRIVCSKSFLGAEAPSRARKVIRTGDILVSTVRPNLNAVALVPPSLNDQVASTGFCVLRATPRVLPEYLFFFSRSRKFVDGLSAFVVGAMYPAVSDGQVLDQSLPLPPLPEQRRLVDILTRAEGIVRLHREALAKTRELIPALFLDLFGDPATNPKGWPARPLSEVAEVISGATKGRKIAPEDAIELPYMRVANVQDGHLDLSEIKTITVKKGEIDKYRLLSGDLLMTEGGDPDKLGRAALWTGAIDPCLHQNHVFKVRCKKEAVLPEYLRTLVGSHYGKAYFLKVAKRTTGIASINKTQLSGFPVLLPPLTTQAEFANRVAGAESIQSQTTTALETAQATFQSLLHSAFESVPDAIGKPAAALTVNT